VFRQTLHLRCVEELHLYDWCPWWRGEWCSGKSLPQTWQWALSVQYLRRLPEVPTHCPPPDLCKGFRNQWWEWHFRTRQTLQSRTSHLEVHGGNCRATGNLDTCTPVGHLHVAFKIPYVYDCVTNWCRKQVLSKSKCTRYWTRKSHA
jgi:hypothetical protein